MELLAHIVHSFPSSWWYSFSIFQFRKSLIWWMYSCSLTGTACADYNVYDSKIMKVYFPLRMHSMRSTINNLRLLLKRLLKILDFLWSKPINERDNAGWLSRSSCFLPLMWSFFCTTLLIYPLKNLSPNPQKRFSSGFLLMFVELALTHNCGSESKAQ